MALIARTDLVVDYGSTHIKGALVESNLLGGRRILRLESLPIVSLGQNGDRKAEEYEYNLVRFVQSFFPEEESFILNVPMDRIFVRDVKVPVVGAKQIEDVVPFEVEPLLPVSLEHAEVIGRAWSSTEDSSNVISFTAKHDDLQAAVQPILKGNASVQMLSIDCVGLSGMHALLPGSAESGALYGQIDIGGTYTILNFLKEGKLIFTRRIPFGGEAVTEMTADLLGLELQAAEEKKLELDIDLLEDSEKTERAETFYRRHRTDKKTFAKLTKKVRESFEELIAEIDRSALSLPTGEEPSVYYVSGGGSLLRGMEAFLSSKLDSPVQRYPLSLEGGDRDLSSFATALGTVEHFKEKQARKVDFLHTPFGALLRRTDFTLRALATPILFGSAALIFFLLSFLLGIVQDRRQINAYTAQMARIATEIPEFKGTSVEDAVKLCNDRLQFRRNQTGAVKSLEVLREITARMPAASEMAFAMKRFQMNEKDINVEAEVDGFPDVQKVVDALRPSQMFARVESINPTQQPNRKIRLQLKLSLKDKGTNAGGGCR
jgi:general secretion pathway protein L